MKKLFYIFLLFVGIVGCQDDTTYPFQGENAVYFQLEPNDYYWSRTQDSLVYTFAGKGVDEDTLWVRVNLEGNTTKEGRPVVVVVDAEKTTAEEGLHYEALQASYELPGDSVYVNVPIIVYNQDKALDSTQVVITLALKPTEALGLGITERRSTRIVVSNMLKDPEYWETNVKYDFGVYSRIKHELCIMELGTDFPATGEEYSEERTKWQIYGKYMSNYFEEHYPIYDEDGVAIEPW